MTFLYEKQCWCGDCHRNHVIKLYSTAELNELDKARFFVPGDYADQLRTHSVCGSCGANITPHTDIDIMVTQGEWKDICLPCLRAFTPQSDD